MSLKKEIVFRFSLVYVIFVLMALAIVFKIIYIQFVEGNKWRAMAKNITYKDITIEPSPTGHLHSILRAKDGPQSRWANR